MSSKIRREMPLKRTRSVIVGVFAAVALVACGTGGEAPGASEDGDLRQVHFILDFTPTGYQSPLFLALENGYWADEGLAVTISRGFGSGNTAARIGTGEGEFGFAGLPDTMAGILEGLEVVEIASVFTVDAEGVAVSPEADFTGEATDLLQLRGAAESHEEPAETYLGAFMRQEGLDVNDIDWIFLQDVGAAEIASGQADFAQIWVTSLPGWWLADPPIEADILWYGPLLDVYGNGLITHRQILDEDPDLVERFVRGAFRGYQYVMEGGATAQQESLDALFKYHPDLKEQPAAEDFYLANLQVCIAMMLREETRETGIGYMIPEKMERTVQLINDFILDEPLDVDQVFAGDNQPLEPGDFTIEDYDEALASVEQVLGRTNPALP